MLNFLKKFGIFCFLDNHGYDFNKSYECIAGAGVVRYVISDSITGLQNIGLFQKQGRDWIFGHVGYDVKNEIEHLQSSNPDGIQFPDFLFFCSRDCFHCNAK